jgi:hypothetical protein
MRSGRIRRNRFASTCYPPIGAIILSAR